METYLVQARNELGGEDKYQGIAHGEEGCKELYAALLKQYEFVFCYKIENFAPFTFEEEEELREKGVYYWDGEIHRY